MVAVAAQRVMAKKATEQRYARRAKLMNYARTLARSGECAGAEVDTTQPIRPPGRSDGGAGCGWFASAVGVKRVAFAPEQGHEKRRRVAEHGIAGEAFKSSGVVVAEGRHCADFTGALSN